ncbi:Carbon monoxide dehydrogenase subunit G [Pedococcus cremeus]|uniref:Carbon monoxide dehydrogenase subunit G n=1 Tax=Pedococcus cremeus TaxID=587636 RepID=A0A1H9XUK0_9MICO|nr:SRPBCC family protein [Pedococcus cremeus]SES49739.1 Carbon monoxide dehydrogenase subunit G [Pedococcus cremeus]
MELKHSFTVPAGAEDAWRTFMDLETVGGCFPGATVTDVTADGFSGTVKVKLGPIALQYAGSGSFVERDEAARRAVISARGKDKRGNGTAGATVTIQLVPDGDGTTRADVTTDLTVTGKPAQFGRGVMQDVSDKLLQQFIDCIEGKLAPESAAAAEVTTAPEGEAAAPVPAPAPAPAAAPAPAVAPAAPTRVPAAAEEKAIDLGRTVLPVLLRTWGPPFAAGVLVSAVVMWLLGRRRRTG